MLGKCFASKLCPQPLDLVLTRFHMPAFPHSGLWICSTEASGVALQALPWPNHPWLCLGLDGAVYGGNTNEQHQGRRHLPHGPFLFG